MRRPAVVALSALLAASAAAQVEPPAEDGAAFYREQVRPILEQRCLKCHGRDPERLRGGLALTSRAALLRGGDLGPAFDPATPDRSLLLAAIGYEDEHLQMPPDGRLDDAELAVLRRWVALGAPFGGDEDALVEAPADPEAAFEIPAHERAWWSYRPLERPAPPAVAAKDWPANDVDRFVLARLEAAGLAPAPEADRRTLIRRATHDLTGLPPTPEAVEAFVRDPDPRAYERLVDALLDSPQYGVRWGRHWLDLVRFAETDSYERDRLKPGAWRYRDWVIDALNADMPYDAFLVHQLAGDEIERPTAASIVATGFLRLGIWDDEPTDLELAQYDDLDSVLDTTCRVMLGMSMGCARCHEHKGDPIPQADYYRMLAFFRGMKPYKAQLGNATTPENYVDRIPADLGDAAAEAKLRHWAAQRDELLAGIRAARDAVRAAAGEAAVAAAVAERDAGLVVHLRLDERTALVAHDERGAFHGRVSDDALETGVPGVEGTAYRFDGRDDWIRIPRPVQDDFTLAIWFRTDAVAPGGSDLRWFRGWGLIDGEIPGIVRDFGLSLVGDGHVTAGTGDPETFVSSGAGHNDGRWHHAALVRERASGAVRLFADGRLVGEAVGTTAALDAPAFLDVGRIQAGGGRFRGDLDEARVYDRALAADEVLDLFLGGASAAPFRRLAEAHAPDAARAIRDGIERFARLEPPRRETIEVLRVKEHGPVAPETHVLVRGNPHAPGAPVEPGFPRILDERAPALPAPSADAASSGRRRALAAWIADPSNLRTARVMANRIWQFHLGRPIVPTPNDFGRLGLEPTHPELLDWLACELVDGGWTLKRMHRIVMTSRTYRMSSRIDERTAAADPENLLLAAFPMRRLAAEEIRDAILAVNGTLNLEMGGPGVYPEMPEAILATASRPDEAWGRSPPEQAARRSVYIHVKRSLLVPFLETFDLADTDASCPVRFVTTQPTQALTMLNSDFMQVQSRLLADRLRRESGGDLDAAIARAIELVAARPAEAIEIAEGRALLRDLEAEGLAPDAALAAWCLAVLNLNEFVYLD